MNALTKLAATGVAIALLSGGAAAQTIGMATLPAGAINNVTTQVIAKVVQANTELKARVLPFRGTQAVQTAVNVGDADFGIGDIGSMVAALDGIDEFKGRPLSNLRMAFRIRTLPIGVFVRKDSPIQTVADIKGKRYSSKWSAFPNAIPLSNAIFATAGFTLADIDGVPASNIIRGADDFKAGKTDVGFFAVGAPKVAEINSAVGGIRWISLENTVQTLAAMRGVRSNYFIHTVNPSPVNAGITGPTNVLGVDVVIFTHAGGANDVVEKFLAGVHPNKEELIKGHPLFRGFVPKLMAKPFSGVAYHPGAVAFYKKAGVWPGN